MIRRCLILGAVAALVLYSAARPAVASGIQPATSGGFTGNVSIDMPTGPNVFVVPNVPTNPYHVAQPDWMTALGRVSGWNFQSVRLEYNPTNATMLVGMQFF